MEGKRPRGVCPFKLCGRLPHQPLRSVNELRIPFVGRALRLSSARSLQPRFPVAENLHLLIHAGFFQQSFNFRARKPLAERLGAVGDSPCGHGRERRVQLQFADVHLVECVGLRVIIGEIVCFLLVGDQSRHAFEKEIKIVGAERSVGSVIE